jgi:hypothetical protein
MFDRGCPLASDPRPGIRDLIHLRQNLIKGIATVVCEASQFEAQFTLCEEANDERFLGSAGKATKKFRQGLKLSQRELRQARFATYWPRRYLNVNGSELFDGHLLNHMRFSQASFWFVFTNSCSAFGSTLRKRPASAGTIETIASIISFGSR